MKLSFIIFDIRPDPGTLTLRAEPQSARMSKIINDSLSRSVTGYSCRHMATVGVKGLNIPYIVVRAEWGFEE